MVADIQLVTQALRFAAEKHVDQRRKGMRKEPYLNHLAEVADLLAEATEGEDPELVAAGLLHDAIEDVGATREELETLFGPDVANLVVEVTDDKALPKAERKRLQVERTPHKSSRAKMIKIADKISNLRALASSPPDDWSEERVAQYVAWAERVVEGARGVSPWLERQFDDLVRARCQTSRAQAST